MLANAVSHVSDFTQFSVDELMELEDIEKKVATSIYQFFHNHDNLEMLKEIERLGLSVKNLKKKNINNLAHLSGNTFFIYRHDTNVKEEVKQKN